MLQKKDIDPQEAISLIDLALSQDETNPFAQTALGLFYYNAGEPQRASISLKQAIGKQVKHPLAWDLMIKILRNDQTAVRSAKETILDMVGRSLDDQLRVEAINGYSVATRKEVVSRLEEFYDKLDKGRHGKNSTEL